MKTYEKYLLIEEKDINVKLKWVKEAMMEAGVNKTKQAKVLTALVDMIGPGGK